MRWHSNPIGLLRNEKKRMGIALYPTEAKTKKEEKQIRQAELVEVRVSQEEENTIAL